MNAVQYCNTVTCTLSIVSAYDPRSVRRDARTLPLIEDYEPGRTGEAGAVVVR